MSADSDATPKFPTETFEAIIDQGVSLNEESSVVAKLLGVFSLVSKSWLPRSRHHLFQILTIDGDTRIEAQPFLNLLDSPLCSFKPYVQILELGDNLGGEKVWLRDALPRLSVLSAVRELCIDTGIFNYPSYPVKVLSDFSNLQLLMLEDCRFYSPGQLFKTLSMCTSLKKIGCYGLKISCDSAVINSPPPSSLTFFQLYYGHAISNNDMMEWLALGEQVPAIETLGLSVRDGESRAIGQGLRRLGPCLKNLEMQFTSWNRFDKWNPDTFLRDVDLRYNTNLISISFSFGPIASLLAQVASSEVREVVLDVGTAFDYWQKNVDWDTVARVLDQPNFSNLERLLIPDVQRDMEGVRQKMMQRFLPGRARDKLVLCEEWFGYDPRL